MDLLGDCLPIGLDAQEQWITPATWKRTILAWMGWTMTCFTLMTLDLQGMLVTVYTFLQLALHWIHISKRSRRKVSGKHVLRCRLHGSCSALQTSSTGSTCRGDTVCSIQATVSRYGDPQQEDSGTVCTYVRAQAEARMNAEVLLTFPETEKSASSTCK
nr:bcl-2-modifying factor isoform X4 [Dromaius novaehollandiae]